MKNRDPDRARVLQALLEAIENAQRVADELGAHSVGIRLDGAIVDLARALGGEPPSITAH